MVIAIAREELAESHRSLVDEVVIVLVDVE